MLPRCMRVRFAPSPTGALHIGGARTALYNWLLARGQRRRARAADRGHRPRALDAGERRADLRGAASGSGSTATASPSSSPARADRHAEVVEQLLDGGHAYRSTAGPDEVKAFKEANGNRGFRGEDEGEGAVRLRVPDEGVTTVVDVVRGETPFENALQDDLVIARADGTPVYHLAVVVDDPTPASPTSSAAPTTTPTRPSTSSSSRRWARRRPSTPTCRCSTGRTARSSPSATAPRPCRSCATRGYLPEAVRNYLALLGWGYDEATTFFTTEELQRRFSLERVSKSPAVFDEQKLRWMNGRYVRELAVEDLTARLEALHGPHRPARRRRGHAGEDLHARRVLAARRAPSSRARSTTPRRARSSSRPSGRAGAAAARERARRPAGAVDRRSRRERAAPGRRGSGMKAKAVFQPLRVALTGTTDLPGHLRDRRARRA